MTNNDELERERFERWLKKEWPSIHRLPKSDTQASIIKAIARTAWLARSKQEEA